MLACHRDPVYARSVASLRKPKAPSRPGPAERDQVLRVVAWYFRQVYGRTEGPGTLPFYCDEQRVGAFAVRPADLATGDDEALFRLLVTISMYQARRDTLIMRQQREMPAATATALCSARALGDQIERHACPALATAETFDRECDVNKRSGVPNCDSQPSLPCHVKSASLALKRTGDMGKLATSAWLHLWPSGGFGPLLRSPCLRNLDPAARANALVDRLASVHRFGRKLATLFVAALSTPALAPGLTPWFPFIDGNELVVIDTNVVRATTVLSPSSASGSRNYDALARWVRSHAVGIDLAGFHQSVPRYSPRIVQQALYSFASRSNRVANRDPCAGGLGLACSSCVEALCPFASR